MHARAHERTHTACCENSAYTGKAGKDKFCVDGWGCGLVG